MADFEYNFEWDVREVAANIHKTVPMKTAGLLDNRGWLLVVEWRK
jgi:hypothetical protein